MPVQNLRAHAVNRRDPRVVDGKRRLLEPDASQRRAHALADLSRGRLGEGDDEDLAEVVEEGLSALPRSGAQRPRDTLGKGKGLAGTSARLNEEGRVEGLGDLSLTSVQAGEVDQRGIAGIRHLEHLLSQLSTGQ